MIGICILINVFRDMGIWGLSVPLFCPPVFSPLFFQGRGWCWCAVCGIYLESRQGRWLAQKSRWQFSVRMSYLDWWRSCVPFLLLWCPTGYHRCKEIIQATLRFVSPRCTLLTSFLSIFLHDLAEYNGNDYQTWSYCRTTSHSSRL